MDRTPLAFFAAWAIQLRNPHCSSACNRQADLREMASGRVGGAHGKQYRNDAYIRYYSNASNFAHGNIGRSMDFIWQISFGVGAVHAFRHQVHQIRLACLWPPRNSGTLGAPCYSKSSGGRFQRGLGLGTPNFQNLHLRAPTKSSPRENAADTKHTGTPVPPVW